MLASGSFHLSGNFWAPLAVVVAVLVPVIIWRLGTPSRLLLYSLVSDTALLTSHARARTAGAELQIILGGQELTDPHFVALRIESRSRADVRPEDFTAGRALMFELAAPILKVLDADTGGEAMPEVPTGADGTRVTIGPALINRRQVITLGLLTDGPAEGREGAPRLQDHSTSAVILNPARPQGRPPTSSVTTQSDPRSLGVALVHVDLGDRMFGRKTLLAGVGYRPGIQAPESAPTGERLSNAPLAEQRGRLGWRGVAMRGPPEML